MRVDHPVTHSHAAGSMHQRKSAHFARMAINLIVSEKGDFRWAHKVVAHFKLYDDFPEVPRLHRLQTVERLVRKGRAQVAINLAEEDPLVRLPLFELLIEYKEFVLAARIREEWGLQDDVAVVQDSDIATQRAAREQMYLQPRLHRQDILLVDSRESFHQASRLLARGAWLLQHHAAPHARMQRRIT